MTLQNKMIVITIGALFLALGAILPSLLILWDNAEKNTVSIQQTSLSNLIKRSVDTLYPQMTPVLRDINRNRTLKKAVQISDREKIEENMLTTALRLVAEKILDQLEILSTSGELLYSSAGNRGNTRQVVAQMVNEQNKNIEGLAKDSTGKLFAFVGAPITNRGKQIGVVLLAKDISQTLKQTALIDSSQIIIIDNNKKILAQSATNKRQDLKLPEIGKSKIDIIENANNIVEQINIVPLLNLQQKAIAHLAHITDITNKHQYNNKLFILNSIFLVILFLLITIFLHWFIKKEFRGIYQAVAVQKQIADGNNR
jgi:hypothetical protein